MDVSNSDDGNKAGDTRTAVVTARSDGRQDGCRISAMTVARLQRKYLFVGRLICNY